MACAGKHIWLLIFFVLFASRQKEHKLLSVEKSPAMKKNLQRINLALITLALLVTIDSCGPGSVALFNKGMEDTMNKLDGTLKAAIIEGDFRLEKELRSIKLIVDQIGNNVGEEMQRNRTFADETITDTFLKLNAMIDSAKGGILDVNDFLILDAQNLINQIPFKKDIYIIREIHGYGTQYQENGFYKYSLEGNAFSPTTSYKIRLNDSIEVSRNDIFSSGENVLEFNIPVKRLNHLFLNHAVNRAKLKISCFKNPEVDSEDPFFDFTIEILLLPRYPIHYSFLEWLGKMKRPSNGEFRVLPFSFSIGPTGKDERWEHRETDLYVPDFLKHRFISCELYPCGGHCEWIPPRISEDSISVHLKFGNQCHDCTRTFSGQVKYIELEPTTIKNYRTFESDTLKSQLLRYGTHTLNLSSNYQSFEIIVQLFNGRNFILSRTRPSENGCSIRVENSQNGKTKRLYFDIRS